MSDKYIRLLVISLALSIPLFGCGGGGGGSSSTTTPIGTSVNLGVIKSFSEASGAPGTTISFNLSGTVSNGHISNNLIGTASYNVSQPTTTVISSVTTTVNVLQSMISLTNTASDITSSDVFASYILTTGYLMKEVDGSTGLIGTPTGTQTLLPAIAKVGDSGSYITLSYSDGTTETQTWRIDPGNNGDAILVIVTTTTDTLSNVTDTGSDAYTIKPDGTISALSINNYDVSSGTTINLTGAAGPVAILHAPPTGVVALAGDGQVSIIWDMMSGAAGYNIYWSTTPGVTTTTGTKISNIPFGALPYSYTHTGLNNGTAYYYIMTATLLGGTESSASSEVSATPLAGATMAVTKDATNITDTTATLNGSLNNPAGYTTTVWFEYGTTTSYGNTTTPAAYAQTGAIPVTANTTGLLAQTLYHVRLVTQDTGGTFYGADKTFRTYITPQVLASGLNGPTDLVVDAFNVFWTVWYDGTVSKTSIGGGPITTLASEGPFNYASGIAIDATKVYWTEYGSGKIKSVPMSGGAVTTITSGLNGPGILKLQSGTLYCIESGAIVKVDISSGATTTLATGSTSYGIAGDIAVDSTSVYWTDTSGGAIKKVGINGGTVITLATGYTQGPIAVDSSSVYWAGSMDALGIKKTGINGGAATTLALTSENVTDLAVDSGFVYWVEHYSSGNSSLWSIRKVSISGGEITTLAQGQYISAYASATTLAIDSTSIYWIVSGSNYYPPLGSINKIPKSY